VSRTPASRRPPRLPDVAARIPGPPDPPRPPSVRRQLTRSRAAGPHARLGASGLADIERRVALDDPRVLCGLDAFGDLDPVEVHAVARRVWGVGDDGPSVAIDPDRTLGAFGVALARIESVARRGGRIACATGRPASLLPLVRALHDLAVAFGADVPRRFQTEVFHAEGRAARRLVWIEGVAMLTDGDALLATDGRDAGEELLFHVGRPDLVIGDGGFVGCATRAGIEVVALADLDHVALAVAAARGAPVTIVPLDVRRPAPAYDALVTRVVAVRAGSDRNPAP
jgi:hypothetical protein